MKNYAILLLLRLSLHTLVAADPNTFTQKGSDSYIGDESKIPKDIGSNDIEVQDDGDLTVTFGPERSKKLLDVLKKYCKNPEDAECKKQSEEVIGLGATGDGIQKRFIQLIPVIGVVALAFTVGAIIRYITDRIDQSYQKTRVVNVKIPKEQKEEVSNWDISDEDRFMYMPENGELVEVYFDNDQPMPEHDVKLEEDESGTVTVTLPEEMVPSIEEGWDVVRCGQFPLKRSLEKRVTMADINRCMQSILRLAQIGGPAAGIIQVDANWVSKPDNEPTVEEIFGEGKKYADKMHYPKDTDANRKAEAVEVAYALSSGTVAGIPFEKGKMRIPAIVWRRPLKQQDDDCPKGNDRTFCVNCGGNALKDVDEVNAIGRCMGVKNGDKLSFEACECFQDARILTHPMDEAQMKLAYDFFKSQDERDDDDDNDDDKKPKYKKTCYKEDAERMKDHRNWKFVQQKTLAKNIDTYCNDFEQTTGDEKVTKSVPFKDEDNDGWNTVTLHIEEPKGGLVDSDRCKTLFRQISDGCDGDAKLNQFDFKWGGEVQDEDGVWAWFEPEWSRVHMEKDDALTKSSRGCRPGKDIESVDDSARMTLQMCIHQMRHTSENMHEDCGGLLKLVVARANYKSKWDCSNNTWKCLSYYVENGRQATASHSPQLAKCLSILGENPSSDDIPF